MYNEISTKRVVLLENVLPVLIGSLAFFIILGWDFLRFDNVRWLQEYDDSAQHYIGWLFYRHAPWTLPIGSNPNYGLEVANSILYSDSIPILALFFKPFSLFLPESFQYFGLWYLLCFMLQACFAYRLVGIITSDLRIKACATGLFVFSPPMLNRLVCHSALVGHWLILAALYLCLAEVRQSKKWRWLLLAFVASLTHAYLLAMVLLLWASDALKRLISREAGLTAIVHEIVLVLTGVLVALWQAGYFLVKSGKLVEGYGVYKMNVFSLINPSVNVNFLGKHAFSYVLPELPLPGGEFEGFNFLGLGTIGLLGAVLPRVLGRFGEIRVGKIWWPLSIICFGLSLFAISNKVGVGNLEFTVWIPETISYAASMLRSSGRMFWPVFYLLLWVLLFLLVNSYKKNTALAVLLVAFVLQVADTRAGWGPIRSEPGTGVGAWKTSLVSPFWREAADTYKKIRVFPPLELSPIRFDAAHLAGINRMGTDAADLARYDQDAMDKLKSYYENIFSSGNYDNDTLYIFDERYVDYALKNLHGDIDLFGKIDNCYIVAPNWKINNRH